MAANLQVTVEGAKELRKIARKLEDKEAKKALSAGHKQIAGIVADEIKRTIPVDSEALSRAVRPRGSLAAGKVAIGGARVPYAGRVLYGDPIPGIVGQPTHLEAVADKLDESREAVEDLYRDIAQKLATKGNA